MSRTQRGAVGACLVGGGLLAAFAFGVASNADDRVLNALVAIGAALGAIANGWYRLRRRRLLVTRKHVLLGSWLGSLVLAPVIVGATGASAELIGEALGRAIIMGLLLGVVLSIVYDVWLAPAASPTPGTPIELGAPRRTTQQFPSSMSSVPATRDTMQGSSPGAPTDGSTGEATRAVRDEVECTFCAELILAKARVCKHCGRDVAPRSAPLALREAAPANSGLSSPKPTSEHAKAGSTPGTPSLPSPDTGAENSVDTVAGADGALLRRKSDWAASRKSIAPESGASAVVGAAGEGADGAVSGVAGALSASVELPPGHPTDLGIPRSSSSDEQSGGATTGSAPRERAPALGKSGAPPLSAREHPDLRGVGGWLGFFLFGQAVSVVILAYYVYTNLHAAAVLRPTLSAIAPSVLTSLYLLVALQVFVAVSAIVGIGMIVQKHPRTPTYWCVLLVLMMPALITLIIHDYSIAESLQKMSGEVSSLPAPDAKIVRAIVVLACWLTYWIRSKRVHATFGYSGFRRPAAPQAQSALASGSVYTGASRAPAEIPLAVAAIALVGFGCLGWIASISRTSGGKTSAHGASPFDSLPDLPGVSPNGSSEDPSDRYLRIYGRYLPLLDSVLPPASEADRFVQLKHYQAEVRRGWNKLDDTALLPYAAALGRVYAGMPEAECAAVADTVVTDKARQALASSLLYADSATQDAVVRGVVLSVVADLAGAKMRVPPAPLLNRANKHFDSILGAENAARLERTLYTSRASASTADLCWALVTIYRRAPRELPAEEAAAILRDIRGA